jgi:hypothetical protein
MKGALGIMLGAAAFVLAAHLLIPVPSMAAVSIGGTPTLSALVTA